MMLVGSASGDVVAINLDPKKYEYYYLEVNKDGTEDRVFCTTVMGAQ